jgi:hypothetical protein
LATHPAQGFHRAFGHLAGSLAKGGAHPRGAHHHVQQVQLGIHLHLHGVVAADGPIQAPHYQHRQLGGEF